MDEKREVDATPIGGASEDEVYANGEQDTEGLTEEQATQADVNGEPQPPEPEAAEGTVAIPSEPAADLAEEGEPEDGEVREAKLALECLLFVGNEPLPPLRLCDILEVSRKTLDKAVEELRSDLRGRSLQVVEIAGGLRMMTRPRFHRYVERYFEPRPERISRAGLECLAVIAYRQPVTRPEIDAIRGVNSSGSVDSLLRKGLIKEVGRKDVPGRPILYSTTEAFLEVAGLSDLGQLPKAEAGGIPSHLLGIPMEPDGERDLPLDLADEAPEETAPEVESEEGAVE